MVSWDHKFSGSDATFTRDDEDEIESGRSVGAGDPMMTVPVRGANACTRPVNMAIEKYMPRPRGSVGILIHTCPIRTPHFSSLLFRPQALDQHLWRIEICPFTLPSNRCDD